MKHFRNILFSKQPRPRIYRLVITNEVWMFVYSPFCHGIWSQKGWKRRSARMIIDINTVLGNFCKHQMDRESVKWLLYEIQEIWSIRCTLTLELSWNISQPALLPENANMDSPWIDKYKSTKTLLNIFNFWG